MLNKDNISIDSYIDRLVNAYYPSFDPFFIRIPQTKINDFIKYDIVGNYLYERPILTENDIRKKYLFLIVIKLLSISNDTLIDNRIHALRGELHTLLFKEQAKQLAYTFINKCSEERTFNEFKKLLRFNLLHSI